MSLAEKYREHYTIEDYKQWQGDWELIEGIPFAMASFTFADHQIIISQIIYLLKREISDRNSCKNCFVIPEVDWIVRYDTVLRPDVVVTCNIPELQSHLKEKPEVVFEVISPSTAKKDENLKYEIYWRERVPYYVLVYPKFKKIRVYKLVDGSYEIAFDGTSGKFELEFNNCKISLKVKEIFDNI